MFEVKYVYAFEERTIPAGADKLVACLAQGPQEAYLAKDVLSRKITFRIVRKNSEYRVIKQRERRLLWWSWTTEDWVRVGYVPMVWGSQAEADEWIHDLKERAEAITRQWEDCFQGTK